MLNYIINEISFVFFPYIWSRKQKTFTMNSYLPIPDKIPGEDQKKDKDPIEKADERNEVKNAIAIVLIASSILAGMHTWDMLCSPLPPTGLDKFLFGYTIVAFFVGIFLLLSANYVDNPHMSGWPWWW